MVQPNEMNLNFPMEIAGGIIASTTKVREILQASYEGDPRK